MMTRISCLIVADFKNPLNHVYEARKGNRWKDLSIIATYSIMRRTNNEIIRELSVNEYMIFRLTSNN
jgi:hypothetical protein